MVKLIRGKVTIEPKKVEGESDVNGVSLTPLDLSDPEDYEDDLDDEDYDEIDLLPERDGSTFATAIAPWVGAEKEWRSGEIKARLSDDKSEDSGRDKTPLELVVTESDMSTVLSSVPPSKQNIGTPKPIMRLLSYVAVAAVSVVVTWWVTHSGLPERNSVSDDKSTSRVLAAEDLTIVDDNPACQSGAMCEPVGNEPVTGADEQAVSSASFHEVVSLESRVEDVSNVGDAKSDDEPNEMDEGTSSKKKSVKPRLVKQRYRKRHIVEHAEPSPSIAEETGDDEKELGNGVSNEEATAAVEAEQVLDSEDAPTKLPLLNEDDALEKSDVLPPPDDGRDTENDPKVSLEAVDAPLKSLSKTLVKETMDSIASKVSQCRTAASGRLVVELEVAGSTGKVTTAKVLDDKIVGPDAGRCAVRAVKMLRFPTFEKSVLTIKYPFDL